MKRALTQQACRKVIPTFLDMLAQLKQSAFKALASLGKTQSIWKDEVARMWCFSKSNGITEGFHRKMKFSKELMVLEILKITEYVLGFSAGD